MKKKPPIVYLAQPMVLPDDRPWHNDGGIEIVFTPDLHRIAAKSA